MSSDAELFKSFKAAVVGEHHQTVLDRFYYGRPSAILGPDREALLRREISDHFGVAMRDVILTGSAKLGFTIVAKRDRPPFSPFSDSSDIDIAIVSRDLFLKFWKRVSEESIPPEEWPDGARFRKYLARGWLRPDLFPRGTAFPERHEWFEYFRSLRESGRFGDYKMAAGVYYDEEFWERYAANAIAFCKQHIESGL